MEEEEEEDGGGGWYGHISRGRADVLRGRYLWRTELIGATASCTRRGLSHPSNCMYSVHKKSKAACIPYRSCSQSTALSSSLLWGLGEKERSVALAHRRTPDRQRPPENTYGIQQTGRV